MFENLWLNLFVLNKLINYFGPEFLCRTCNPLCNLWNSCPSLFCAEWPWFWSTNCPCQIQLFFIFGFLVFPFLVDDASYFCAAIFFFSLEKASTSESDAKQNCHTAFRILSSQNFSHNSVIELFIIRLLTSNFPESSCLHSLAQQVIRNQYKCPTKEFRKK